MAEDPGHKRSLRSQDKGGGRGLEGPWGFCWTEGASVKGAQHGSSGTRALSGLYGLCGAHKEMPPVHPRPQQPPGPLAHICMKMGPCSCGYCGVIFKYIDLSSRFHGFIEGRRSIRCRAARNFSEWMNSQEPLRNLSGTNPVSLHTFSFKMCNEKINVRNSF